MLYNDNKIIDISNQGLSYIDGLTWRDPFEPGSPAADLGVTTFADFRNALYEIGHRGQFDINRRIPFVILRKKGALHAYIVDIRNLKWKSIDLTLAEWTSFKRDNVRLTSPYAGFVWAGAYHE